MSSVCGPTAREPFDIIAQVKNFKDIFPAMIQAFEYFFAVMLLFIVFVSVVTSIGVFVQSDWSRNQTFYDLIYRILLLVIGLELARLLITHNLQSVIELIAFVIARKTLKPDVTSFDILLIGISFALLILSRVIISIDLQSLINHLYGRTKN